MVLIKDLVKVLDEIRYKAGVACDYSREIHMDPDEREELRKELEEIINRINEIEMYHFSEIIDNVIELKYELPTYLLK